ncbi:MAG: hypothetical protein B7Y36_18860 [Novosphingobium sp. 28-62-57]|uniref:helix-turn-helix transcriptional regulator n=1 Tax=Novosphingobium sp. 28-62-57 TaxID=1970409 RepID=UPI000BC7A728|nr:helix-turn-helix transcriptional regulator [Novosphingobium sp. 28-62-57]OYW50744.1 MAG: hypothetical protein B7Z34_02655 [Novosphingobium sp. 12-62-10]OYZ07779.1 MAG: hypothetical protein B7Y36_18860 [Novosphingobium sp. 28-62-57]
MTDLQSYLKASGEKQSSFAIRVGTTPATISRLCNGSLRPALDLAHRIETATGGEVPTEVWLSDDASTPCPTGEAA